MYTALVVSLTAIVILVADIIVRMVFRPGAPVQWGTLEDVGLLRAQPWSDTPETMAEMSQFYHGLTRAERRRVRDATEPVDDTTYVIHNGPSAGRHSVDNPQRVVVAPDWMPAVGRRRFPVTITV